MSEGADAPRDTGERLACATTYEFQVAARNGSGTSAYSASVTASPKAIAATPSALAVTAGDAQVALSWRASTGADDYQVRYRVNGSADAWSTTSWTTTTSVTVTSLTNGTTYEFQVAACNGSGTSAYSTSVTAAPKAISATPTGLAATAGDAQVALSWTASTGADDYQIRYRVNGTADACSSAARTTTTSVTVTSLTNGTTYEFQVAACNTSGTSAYSSSVTASPKAVPAMPTGLAATAGDAQVALSWTASTVADDYQIRYRVNGIADAWSTTVWTTTAVTVSSLANGTTYEFQVAARNTSGTSPYSSSVTATPRRRRCRVSGDVVLRCAPDTPVKVPKGAAQPALL